MTTEAKTPAIATLLRNHPRKNLPHRVAAKRGESNFVLAFGRAYTTRAMGELQQRQRSLPARELRVEGFGIADFIWFSWQSNENKDEGSGLGLHSAKCSEKRTLLAFELKMLDWRKALGQAYRYRYFADGAFVVLPPRAAEKAKQFLSTFKVLETGLWSFDRTDSVINEIYTPRTKKPLSESARARAMAAISHRLKAQLTP
jgi:hypothetical protein